MKGGEVRPNVAAVAESLVALRRDLHAHPELSFEERRTAAIVAERLHDAGLEVRTDVGGHGVVGVLRGDRPGRTVAWRADMDALPIEEPRGLPFASLTGGVMHACGHDGHTAVAVHLAELLAAGRSAMSGTAVFLFQPGEEVLGGAKRMIDAGALAEPHVDEVYGLHLVTTLPTGKVLADAGPVLAAADAFEIEVVGKGGHGGSPHLTTNPILPASTIALGLDAVLRGVLSAEELGAISVGTLVAGTKNNVIPQRARLTGTLRTYDEATRAKVLERLAAFVDETAQGFRAQASFSRTPMCCPPVVNHERETTRARTAIEAALGQPLEPGKPGLASDDFAEFLLRRPGAYLRVGAGVAEGPLRLHHSPDYMMNEESLPIALRVAVAVLDAALTP